MSILTKLALALALALAVALPAAAVAQSSASYPEKQVKILLPYPPGGVTDVIARMAGSYLEQRYKQQFIVDNRPGANGQIAADALAKSPNDGYTLFLTGIPLASEQVVNKDWPFRFERDFTSVSIFCGSGGQVLAVPASLPVASLRELVAYSKANPGKLNEGEAGAVSPPMAILRNRLGMGPVELVIYRGGPAVVQALVAGDIQMFLASVPDVVQYEKAGKLKLLAYTGMQRDATIPNVPTVNESGVGLSDFDGSTWLALLGPAGMSPDIANKLNVTLNDMIKLPDYSSKIASAGMRTFVFNPQQTRDRIIAQIKQYADAQAAGIKLQ